LSYGVRSRIVGKRPLADGRKTFALKRTPSRIGTATLIWRMEPDAEPQSVEQKAAAAMR
jgi:hypothetical protein